MRNQLDDLHIEYAHQGGLHFLLDTLLCVITVASVSYVGVYVTYVGLPILLISGFVMVFGSKKKKTVIKSPSLVAESIHAVAGLLRDFNEAMDGVNDDLTRFNRKNELKRERVEKERAAHMELRIQRAKSDLRLRYANSEEEKYAPRQELAALEKQFVVLRDAMTAIEKQCEIDAIEELQGRLGKTLVKSHQSGTSATQGRRRRPG